MFLFKIKNIHKIHCISFLLTSVFLFEISWPNFDLGELQGIPPPSEQRPDDSSRYFVRVFALFVQSVEVGLVTFLEPPSPGVHGCAVIVRLVVVVVPGGELHAVVVAQRVT